MLARVSTGSTLHETTVCLPDRPRRRRFRHPEHPALGAPLWRAAGRTASAAGDLQLRAVYDPAWTAGWLVALLRRDPGPLAGCVRAARARPTAGHNGSPPDDRSRTSAL